MRMIPFLKKLMSSAPPQEKRQDTALRADSVSEVYRLHGTASAVIPEDSPLESVITRFAGEPSLRGIFMVDYQQRFPGVVTRIDLLRWTYLKLLDGKQRHEIAVSEFFRVVDAEKAEDLCHGVQQALRFNENDSLQAALDKMLDHDEDVPPVINSQGKILGNLRLSEILSWVLTHGRNKLQNLSWGC